MASGDCVAICLSTCGKGRKIFRHLVVTHSASAYAMPYTSAPALTEPRQTSDRVGMWWDDGLDNVTLRDTQIHTHCMHEPIKAAEFHSRSCPGYSYH
jgi:hypothetical protein